MKTENKAFIYALIDPKNNEVRYIGKANNPKKRLTQHLLISKNKKTHRDNWLQSLLAADLKPILVILEECQDNWAEREQYYIDKYPNLTNHTKGGEGTNGFKHSEETIQKFSEQRKGKKQTPAQYAANCNRTVSDETKEKLSLTNKGHSRHTPEQIAAIKKSNKERGCSDETKKLMSEQRKGKKQTPAQYAANCNRVYKNYKKVVCLTNGKTYNSVYEAAKDLELKHTAIVQVANGGRKLHKGYVFKYL
jgi:group I intron endonuclease